MERRLRLMLALFGLTLVGSSFAHQAVSYAGRTNQVMQATAVVTATVETAPVPHPNDAADDPAIWIHPTDPALSTVIGTDKQGGLAVYDLAGNQIQYLADGEINNVDLRYGFSLSGQSVAIVAASNDTNNSIAIYRVNATTRQLENVAARTIVAGLSPYGACMYHSPADGVYYVFVDAKDGWVEQWKLFATNGLVDATRVRSFDVGTQVEGCVADDEARALYIGEEAVGIWRYGAEPGAGEARTQVDSTGIGGHLTSNVEGLALYYAADGGGYLIASSQGSDDFALYRRGDNAYVGTFAIAAGVVDRVSDTDGIDVTNFGLGSAFPQGMFVAQDGTNDSGNQNFKLVPWQRIAAAFSPALTIDPVYDPRLAGGPQPTSAPTSNPTATPTPTALPTSGTLPPINPEVDTYVSQSAATTSYAANTQLQAVGGSSSEKRTFLRFNVTGVPVGSVVSSARLRLVVVNESKAGGSVYGMTNTSWAENVTWNSRPAADGPLLASLGSVALNAVLDVDVTAAVTGNGKYSFAIVAPTSSTDTVGYASREASVATRPQLIVAYQAASAATAAPTATATSTPTPANTPTLTAGATATPTPTATGTPMSTALATNTPTRTPTTASTSTSTPTQGTTPTATPSSGTRIKDITFEGSSLTDPISGADSVVGTVALEMSKPLKGTTSAWVKNAGSSYVEERFSAADDLFVSFYVRVNAIPTSSTGEVRIALISNAGSSVGNLVLRIGGALRLRNGSNTVGADSTPLTAGQVYRVGLRQRRGTGANAMLEAYLASGEAAFGQPFASLSNGTWTTAADRLRLGTTISAPLDAVFDDIRLDRGVMP